MARVITSTKDYEQWKSAIKGTIVLKRFDRKGDTINEVVAAGKSISLLPEERRLNQEIAAEPGLDPFQNGMLIPVKLLETADDYDDLQGNPNHLSESDMRALLANPKKLDVLEAAIAELENPTTLQRLRAIAEEPEVDATVRQLRIIDARIAGLGGNSTYIEVETLTTSDGREVLGTDAPESPAPRNTSVGRRAASARKAR